MAVTGFWPVKGKLKAVIDYAENPDKTTDREYVDSDLYAALQYAENDNKTDEKLYVGGINCSKHFAYSQMIAVKKKFGERGTNIAYHGFQSFAEGEVTPEECHEIGVETARKMWGDKYQVVVTTHLDKQHHLHNHFVINSVSFKDGSKFRNKIEDHIRLREISDAICYEHDKIVYTDAPFYGSQKKEYWLHKEGKKTHRDMLREDIEFCISLATSWDKFRTILYSMGYEIDYRRFTVKAKDWERGIRLTNLGYTVSGIEERFHQNLHSDTTRLTWNNYFISRHKYFPLEAMAKKLKFEIEHSKKSEPVLIDIMFLLIIMIFGLLREVADALLLSPEMRHAVKDIKQFVADYHFLTDNKIHTTDDLSITIDETKQKITALEQKRNKADNRKRRAKTPEEKEQYKALRKELTEEIAPLRKKLKQAEKILRESPHLYELLKQEHALERKAINQIRER